MSYITFNTISEVGNLGSQIQQFASLYAIAKKTNKKIIFTESVLNKGFGLKFNEVLDIPIEIKPDDFIKDFVNYRVNDSVEIDYSVFGLSPHINYNIEGRFDLFKYWFDDFKQDISEWKWKSSYFLEAKSQYDKIKIPQKETVSIHLRRGDYLLPQHDHFCKLDNDYYGKALEVFFNDFDKYQFLIFSNDIEWCKENFIEEGECVYFVEPSIDYNDLILMSLCDHNIIANSSYSWWAAFKNQNLNKKVYCPQNYLKNYSPWSYINKNYYPKEWNSIENSAI